MVNSNIGSVDSDDHYNPTVRYVDITRQTSESCGFHLTRSKWDPYPWVSGVDQGSAAESAGLRAGDCVLEVNGEDVIGQRIAEIASQVKSNPEHVSLLLWSSGLESKCNPEALCCGPMPSNLQRLSGCMSAILNVLECPVCLDTIPPPAHQCENGHLICVRCRVKTEKCPVCRVRFTRGRSLVADQIYNSLTDAFELREEPIETRTAKICERIFGQKNKKVAGSSIRIVNSNLKPPELRVTPSHAHKFLSKLVGKASSAENLTETVLSVRPKYLSTNLDEEFVGLKAKSLSTNEIFSSESPSISRTNSAKGVDACGNEIQKHKGHTSSETSFPLRMSVNRVKSYHGSYESLPVPNDAKNGLSHFKPQSKTTDTSLYHCPNQVNCNIMIKSSDLIHHFKEHHTEPLINYFKTKMTVHLFGHSQQNGCIMITAEDVFFLKILQEKVHFSEFEPRDTLVWAWIVGSKDEANKYQFNVLFRSTKEETIQLSMRSPIYSLSNTSWQDVRESHRGIFVTSDTLKANFTNSNFQDLVVDIEIKQN